MLWKINYTTCILRRIPKIYRRDSNYLNLFEAYFVINRVTYSREKRENEKNQITRDLANSGYLQKKPFNGAVYVFRAKRADRLKLIYWDGTGLVLAYKRLEQNTFKWPAIRDGMMQLNPAQFETLFAGLDWRFVTQLDVTPPAAAE